MLTVILSFMLVFSVLLSSSSMVFAEETVLTENIIEQEVSDSLTDDMISDGESDENISDSISETQEMQEALDSSSDYASTELYGRLFETRGFLYNGRL